LATARHETAVAAYYRVELRPWLHVSPHIHYLVHPGGMRNVADALVAGVRIQAAFQVRGEVSWLFFPGADQVLR